MLYYSGEVITIRDRAMKRIIEEGSPVDISGKLVYIAGPIVRGDVISCGPTTATRVEPLIYEFIKLTRPRYIVGKGPLYENMERAAREFGTIYALFPGGFGALAAKRLRVIKNIRPELGMPESIWLLEAHRFGPLIPVIYKEGERVINLLREVEERAKERFSRMFNS